MSVFIVVFAAYILLSAHWANHVNLATNEYGNIVIFEVLAFLGVIGFVYAFKTLNCISIYGGVFWSKYFGYLCSTPAHLTNCQVCRRKDIPTIPC